MFVNLIPPFWRKCQPHYHAKLLKQMWGLLIAVFIFEEYLYYQVDWLVRQYSCTQNWVVALTVHKTIFSAIKSSRWNKPTNLNKHIWPAKHTVNGLFLLFCFVVVVAILRCTGFQLVLGTENLEQLTFLLVQKF